MHYRLDRHDQTLRLTLEGEWTVRQVGAIGAALASLSFEGVTRLEVATTQGTLDLSGAWLLRDVLQRAEREGVAVAFLGPRPPALELVEQTLGPGTGPAFVREERPLQPITALGKTVVDRWQGWLSGLAFIGEAVWRFGRALRDPRVWRPTSIARHVYDTGITAIPIVALIATLVPTQF